MTLSWNTFALTQHTSSPTQSINQSINQSPDKNHERQGLGPLSRLLHRPPQMFPPRVSIGSVGGGGGGSACQHDGCDHTFGGRLVNIICRRSSNYSYTFITTHTYSNLLVHPAITHDTPYEPSPPLITPPPPPPPLCRFTRTTSSQSP